MAISAIGFESFSVEGASNLPAIFSPVTETSRGLKAYTRGLRWLKQHPKYLGLLFVPMVIAFGLFLFGWGVFFQYDEQLFAWILFARPESWYMLALYYVCKFFLYVGFLLVGLVSFVLLSNILASPIYEIVSVAVERDIRGGQVDEVSFWEALKLMGEELKKIFFILFISSVLFVIPMVNVLATLVAAFLIGWDFYDYPMARRGWRFSERLTFVSKDFWAVMGFGLWLMIPFVQFILIPMAVAGGTILSLESLEKRQQIQISGNGKGA
jgi:CysZ protein